MSMMSNTARIKCKYCGKPMIVKHMLTTKPDEGGILLEEFMEGLRKTAMCNECKKRYNYLASQGRSEEFLNGATSPISIPTITPTKLRRLIHGKRN